MRSREEIIKALSTIQEVCKESSCCTCPLSDNVGICVISDEGCLNPCDWNIKTSETVWKAFLI